MSLLPPPIIIPPYDHAAATAAAANAVERPIELRARYEAACKRLMDSVEQMNAYTIMNIAIRVFDVWMQNDIMDLEMPTAYACLKYLPVAHPKLKDIAASVLKSAAKPSIPATYSTCTFPKRNATR